MTDWSREFDASESFDRIYRSWPKKAYRTDASRQYGIAVGTAVHPERVAELIERAADAYLRNWKREGGDPRFCQRLDIWLLKERYLDDIADEPEAPAEDAATAMLRRIGL